MKQLVLASNNQGKVDEFNRLLSAFDFDVITQGSLGVEPVPETGLTFLENALIKARHAARVTGLPALADDSGLVVDALDGAPGIYSARFAGEHGDDAANNSKLLQSLAGLAPEQRSAHFHCTLVFMAHADDPDPLVCQGRWPGYIATAVSGSGGFGYDPLFQVPGENCTAAELSKEHKNRISHRGQAVARLLEALQQKYPG